MLTDLNTYLLTFTFFGLWTASVREQSSVGGNY